ncbi:MAG TPA: bifunctional oligoribonuclease/PAP phosphatase NrnA [Vicinamibacterales bacterium]|nr:bifunctional oligoribonuclease/PAP phosphatase NrnA [Vicinamibacterales bacterium]
MTTTPTDPNLQQIVTGIHRRQRFVVTSHARPDGDAIGSSLAMAYALRHLGKDVRVVSRDAVPPQFETCPGVEDVIVTDRVDDPGDAVIVMECGDLTRPGISGLERGYVINIDHHTGNTMYGALNWFDESAAACGEMVFDLVRALGVPMTLEIATHVYVAVLTDTGGFHYSNITPRTFEICRMCTEAGVSPAAIARAVYDSNRIGRLKLFRAVLNGMQLDAAERIATLYVTKQMAADCGATYDDTEGLVNFPLSAKEVLAVVFFKENGKDDWRVSLRSKGDLDINVIAREFGGGGHKNASGCGVRGTLEQWKPIFEQKVSAAIEATAAPL